MVSVQQWSGREASALRAALRMSTRAFADHLGVALRTVAKWESLGAETHPRPDTQAILDTALARADSAAHARFEALLFPERKSTRPADYGRGRSNRNPTGTGRRRDRALSHRHRS